MNLIPRERDKPLISRAAMVARGRLARGVKLNHPEAIVLTTDFVVEGARDGRMVSDLMQAGGHVITADQCMQGVPEMIHSVQVEATFPDRTKLVTVHHPIRRKTDMKRILTLAAATLGLLIPGAALAHPWGHDGFSVTAMIRHLMSQADHLAIPVAVLAAALFVLYRSQARK